MRQFLVVLALCPGVIGADFHKALEAPEPAHPTTLDASFRYADTNMAEIRDLKVFPDGRIAYGGVGLNETAGIANQNGRPEWVHNFAGNFLSVTRSVAVDAEDGAFFIAGSPRSDWAVQRIAFGNDMTWTMKAGIGWVASKVLVLPDRDILGAGLLRVAGDTNFYGLVRLNLEGTLDSDFAYTNTLGLEVITAAVMADGSVLASYQQTNEQFVSYGLGRWLRNGQRDETYDELWATSFGTNSHVTVIEKAPGTNGFVAAVQTEPVGSGGPKFTQLVVLDEQGNSLGSLLENPFVEGAVHAIAFEAVASQTVEANGYDRIVVGGEFSKVEDVPYNNLVSLSREGAVMWGFSPETAPSGPIYTVEVQLDGKVLIGGAFTNVNGIEALGMARIIGSSEVVDRLYWADEEFRGFEKLGEVQMTLGRSGSLDEPLTVVLARPLNAANDVTIPNTVEFAAGQSVVTIPVTIENDLTPETRERFEVTAMVTNENVLLTRERTEIVVLDDETPGTLDPTLQIPPMLGLTGFTFQPDGKILFYGNGRNIVRLNPDGTIDPSFVTNALPTMGSGTPLIFQAIVQPDGKILVAGAFATTISALYGRNGLARLNADGTLDLSFDPRLRLGPSSFFATPLAKAMLLDNGDVLVWLQGSGRVEREGAQFTVGIVRLDQYGNLVGTYGTSTQFRSDGEWVLAASGELITYGNFSGPAQLRKYKADRTVDTGFVAAVTQGFVYDMLVAGNTLWIAGSFQNVNSTSHPNLARLNLTTGALETEGSLEVNGQVNVVREYDGKIYIGGSFTKVNGVERFRIARLNADGSLDMSFDPGHGPNRSIGAIEFQIDGKPLIGSGFDRVDGVPTSWYVRLQGDRGAGEIQFVSARIEVSETNQFVTIEVQRVGGSSGEISATLLTVDGSAHAGQHFGGMNVMVTFADGEFWKMVQIPITADPAETGPRTFSVLLDNSSEATVLLIDEQRPLLRTGINVLGGTNEVRDMAVGADGSTYIGGYFTNIGGVSVTNLARLRPDLLVDTTFAPELPLASNNAAPDANNPFAPITAIAVRPGGEVIYSGSFTNLGANDWRYLVQLSADGSYDASFNDSNRITGGVGSPARQLVLQSDRKLIGHLSENVGLSRVRRINADGTFDVTIPNILEEFIAVHPDGTIYTASFGAVKKYLPGSGLTPIASFQFRMPGGSTSSARVRAIEFAQDGSVLIGGDFNYINSTTYSPSLAKISTNGVVDTNFAAQQPPTPLRRTVEAIAVLPSGEIVIGHDLERGSGVYQKAVALLGPQGETRREFDAIISGRGVVEMEPLPHGGVVVRGGITVVEDVPVGEIFALNFGLPQPPVAKFLWPTNGAVVGVSDVVTETEIRVHAFDPDGFIESAVLEVDGVAVATNSSGNVSFWRFLPGSGPHQLRLTVTDRTGLNASETITYSAVGMGIAVSRSGEEVVISYFGSTLEESSDLRNWSEVHAGGGEYRTDAVADYRFYRSTH